MLIIVIYQLINVMLMMVDYNIYFKTKNTFINKPIAYHDPTKGLLQRDGSDDDTSSGGHLFSYSADFDQQRKSDMNDIADAVQVSAKTITTSKNI